MRILFKSSERLVSEEECNSKTWLAFRLKANVSGQATILIYSTKFNFNRNYKIIKQICLKTVHFRTKILLSLHILNNGFVTFKLVDGIKVKSYSNNSPLATKSPQIPFIFRCYKNKLFFITFFSLVLLIIKRLNANRHFSEFRSTSYPVDAKLKSFSFL